MSQLVLSSWVLCICTVLCVSADFQPCPSNNCPTIPDIDLSSLQGLWETVYYTQAEGEENPDIPNFFNISLCGSLPSSTSCSGSRVCYSRDLEVFSNMGQNCRYEYDTTIKQVKFAFDYAPGSVYGNGNVSVTLICGRTLGVPEVLEGDPNSRAIEILWITSAACRNSSSLATNHQESKCYHVHPYIDNGLKAKFIDLTNLIHPEGYTLSYPERPSSSFILSVCRPLENAGGCSGALACLNQTDPGFNSDVTAPLQLGTIGIDSQLHMEGTLLTVVYSVSVSSGACFDHQSGKGNHSVKIHFLCPTGNEDLGPRIIFLDDDLCLLVVHWYTSYACGNAAIQSSSCTLTTSLGLTFDLTGLSSQMSIASGSQLDSHGIHYRYDFKICSENSLSTGCAARDQPIHVTQIDSEGVCRVLGVGAGRFRYVDGELTLMYRLGDPCHTNFPRTTIIHFICPENVESNSSVITFSGEEDCFYEFEWVTPLACGVQSSGVSSCQFESQGGTYNFAPLVGTENENWVALDTQSDTECFMINPCGTLDVAPDPHTSPAGYCNAKLAPRECTGSSVCQIKKDHSFVKIGHFDFRSTSTQVHSADSNVLTVVGDEPSVNLSAVVHYVCKVGDFTTPPVFIGITNDLLYEFHWMTYAACPTGIEIGNDCTVSHHSTGFVFNLTSLPMLTFNKDGYRYNVSVCKPLAAGMSACPEATTTSVCQAAGAHHYSLGVTNKALVYEDGTLKLHYTGVTQCHHNGNPTRNTTLVFVCDSTAHNPTINDINEDYCNYVIEIRTKQACPPAYQAHSCLHFTQNNTFDFSPLSRASGTGNWETRGRDGSLYYINVCQPLNSVVGCNPLAAVCRVQSNGGSTKYENIALASTANFTSSRQASEDFVSLRYEYKNLGGQSCPTVTTIIRLTCNRSSINIETGPQYASGGDDASPCEYLFTWETVYACPVHPITTHTCALTTSDFTFDLSPLSALNSTLSYFPVHSPAGHTYHLSICNPLDHVCTQNDKGQVAVCQLDTNQNHHTCGLSNTQLLTYFDGSLTMKFTGGDTCHQSKHRSVLINFECDRTLANYKGYPRFVSENEECGYTFDWPTALVCPPQELECLADGGRYNLQALLQQRVWRVRGLDNGYNYVIGGCRSLDISSAPQCPQKAWLGACRYSNDDGEGAGTVLGYVSGDIVVEEGGNLALTYTGGECRGGATGVVHVHFHCGDSLGEPTLVEDDTHNCVVRIDWTTKYACPRDGKVVDWFLEDPVTHQQFNLSALPSILSSTYTERSGTMYNYTVGLGGREAPCPRSWYSNDQVHIGACQVVVNCDHNHFTHCVHSLGHVSSNTTLQYSGGVISVEYLNGDPCHHVDKLRKTVVSFICEPSQGTFLEVFSEEECEYTFAVHTDLVCRESESLGVSCLVPEFANLDVFLSRPAMEVRLNDSAVVYLSVCSSLDLSESRVANCPRGAAACLISNGQAVHLGKPTTPPSALTGDEGVLLSYTGGSVCTAEKRYSTRLLLVCNRNIRMGTPEFIDNSNCQFTFRWESVSACPIHLSYTNNTADVCTIKDTSSEFVYNFTNLLNSQSVFARDPHTNTTYYIQLCGNRTKLSPGIPHGCSATNTGICKKNSNSAHTSTIVSARHKMVITSHAPHSVEVVYDIGLQCGSSPTRTWTATVSLQCTSRQSSTSQPVFQSDDDCQLDFVWQNSSFCVGEEVCSVTDASGHVYNFDGLFSQTWTGTVTTNSIQEGGTFTMSVCRNLNPFSGNGSHCSSPSGVCLHTRDGRHVNLGHMTGPPRLQSTFDPQPTIIAEYINGDVCNSTTGTRYTTTLFLHCAKESSALILSEDNADGNCSWNVAMETPLACNSSSQIPSNPTTGCIMSTSEGEFDFSPLGKPLTFEVGGGKAYTICLCQSALCTNPSINSTITSGKTTQTTRLGTLDTNSLTTSSVTAGPRLTFTGGDSCGAGNIKSMIFMECNRSADLTKGQLTFQASVSDSCHYYFFWSTPYACVSEEVSCTVQDNGKILYDLSPLHSLSKPWKADHQGDTYYINICGPIEDRMSNHLEGCGPQSSVCQRDSSGTLTSLATTSTQRIRVVGDSVEIIFAKDGPVGSCGSHVTIHLTCQVGQLAATPSGSGCFPNHFTWPTPYACGENKGSSTTKCDGSLVSSKEYSFDLSELNKNSYSTTEGDTTYSVSLCGAVTQCGDNVAVCSIENGINVPIAYSHHQTIMTEGYQLLFRIHMNVTVRVVCIKPLQEGNSLPPGTLKLENIGKWEQHTYYFFVLYTTNCTYTPPSTPNSPPTTSQPQAVPAGSSSSTAVVLTLLAIGLVTVVVLIIVFYKKERRATVRHFLEKRIIGKADEPVKYHKVSQEEEETALMDGDSDSDSSLSVGVAEGGGAVKVDIDVTPETRETNSDEELINL